MSLAQHPEVLRFPHPVLKSRALKAGQVRQFSILDRNYVLFRDADGKVAAVPDACPHRGAPLSRGKVNAEGELVCGYHAWRICSNGHARSLAVPKKSCRVALLKTWERHGYIWVAHEQVSDDAFPEFIDAGYELIARFSSPFDAPLRVAVDNFSEVEHTFKIHRFIGPNAEQLASVEFRTELAEDESRAWSSAVYRALPFGFARLLGIKPGDRYHNDWTFRFSPLFGRYLNYWTSPDGATRRAVSFIVTTFFVPTRDGKATLHTFLQMAVASSPLRLLMPLLRLLAAGIIRYELWADARIARFAPDVQDAERSWQLTGLDKQVIHNRQRVDSLYFRR